MSAAMSFISQRAFALLLMPAALSSSSPQDIFDLLRRGAAAAIDATAGIEDRTAPPVLGRKSEKENL